MNRQRQLFREGCRERNDVCWLCSQPIDYEALYNDWANDDRFELDHFYPVSKYPELQEDPANFRPSHAGCNRERGDEEPAPPIGQQSRDWLALAT